MTRGVKIIITEKDRAEVKAMAAIGMTSADIAIIKGMAESALRRLFRTELKAGRASGKSTIQNRAFQMANSGNFPAMTIFWLKTRCRWREKDRDKSFDKNAKPLTGTLEAHKLPEDPVEAAKIYQKIMSEN